MFRKKNNLFWNEVSDARGQPQGIAPTFLKLRSEVNTVTQNIM